jgi:hypothetical protein
MRRPPGAQSLLALALVALAFGALPAPVSAQQRIVITGFVQWFDGSRMQVMTDTGYSVSVNVSRIDQDVTNAVRQGDRIQVYGFVPPDRRRVIAERIEIGPNTYDNYSTFPQAP